MAYDQNTIRALYKKLLAFYPRGFREQLGESMEQTFNDLCNEKRQTKRGLFGFVLWTFIETATGIIQEHILLLAQGDSMKNIASNPKSAAVVGFLFALPFLILNTIVGTRIEPFVSLIRPGAHTGPFEYVLLFIVVLLIPVGAFIAIRPMLQKGVDGKRKFHLINVTLAAIMLVLFVIISGALISEIYRCNVLQIPNCD